MVALGLDTVITAVHLALPVSHSACQQHASGLHYLAGLAITWHYAMCLSSDTALSSSHWSLTRHYLPITAITSHTPTHLLLHRTRAIHTMCAIAITAPDGLLAVARWVSQVCHVTAHHIWLRHLCALGTAHHTCRALPIHTTQRTMGIPGLAPFSFQTIAHSKLLSVLTPFATLWTAYSWQGPVMIADKNSQRSRQMGHLRHT